MKSYRLATIAILTIAIITGVGCDTETKTKTKINTKAKIKAQPTTANKAIFKQHIALCKQKSIANKQINNELNNRLELLNQYLAVIKALKTGNQTQINYQISNFERNKRYAANALKYSEKNYKRLQAQYDEIKSDKLKIAEVNDLEKKRDSLIARINKRKQPFNAQKNTILNKLNAEQKNRELKSLLATIINPKAGDQAAIANKTNIGAVFKDAFVSCSWKKNKKQIAWTHIRIRTQPENLSTQTKLADKYPITSLGDTTIWLWVGNFRICFVVDDKKLKGKDQVKKTLQKLFNLPELKKISKQKIIKQSITVYESIQKINKASRDATKTLTQEKYNLNRKISDLNKAGYQSSKGIATLKNRLNRANESYNRNKNTIATSDKLLKIVKAPACDYPKEITALEKKTAVMRNEIIAYGIKIKQTQAEQLKGINFTQLNQQYLVFVNKFIKLPKSKEFVLINRIDTDAWLGTQQVTIRWSRDYSTSKSMNIRTEFYGTINYNPDYSTSNSKGMIDDKYPILRLYDSSIMVKVGDFTVILNSSNRSLYDKDSMIKAVKEFYDLNAIASALN